MKTFRTPPLRERISLALDAARGSDDGTRLCTLRLMDAALRDREAARRARDEAGDLDEPEVAEVLCTMLRQRMTSVSGYEESGRLDLAEEERAEMEVIREFLPKPLSEKEVSEAVSGAIAEVGARSLADLAAVMAALKGRWAGRMDFCKAGAEVRDRLRR